MADKFLNPIDLPQLSSTPPSPGAGYHRFYAKADGYPYGLNANGEEQRLVSNIKYLNLNIRSENAISTGDKDFIRVENNFDILSWSITSLQTGTIQIDVLVSNSPYTVFNSITDSNYINLTSSNHNTETDLSVWVSTQINSGALVKFKVISADINNFTLSLKMKQND